MYEGNTYGKWVVTGNEKNMENSGGGQISSKEATGVGQNCPRVEEAQHQEGNGPDAMEDLKRNFNLD